MELFSDAFLEQINFYEYEKEFKKGSVKFLKYLNGIYSNKNVDSLIRVLKSSGACLNLYAIKKSKREIDSLLEEVQGFLSEEDKLKFQKFIQEVEILNEWIRQFHDEKKNFFNETPDSKPEALNSYLLSLELYLRELNELSTATDLKLTNPKYIEHKEIVGDRALTSTGLMLNYFIHQGFPFSKVNKNISYKDIELSVQHIYASSLWNGIKEIIEYWMYSEVEVGISLNEGFLIDIKDASFELYNKISNDRFISMKDSWQLSILQENIESFTGDIFEDLKEIDDRLDILLMFISLGTYEMHEEIRGISIEKWLESYKILKNEAKNLMKKNEKIKLRTFNLKNVCCCLTKKQWIQRLEPLNISKEKREIIIDSFTFKKENKSQDLIDCPLIPADQYLILLPAAILSSDAVMGLVGNFLSRGEQLNFKGDYFEERIRFLLKMAGIENNSLYKKDMNDSEYECDIVFTLDNELFFVECKSHIQPYTPRQQANNLQNLYKEVKQLNRIADFYTNNLDLVSEQLGEKCKSDMKVTRILLVTTKIGLPLIVDGVHIIDESAFSTMIQRSKPTLSSFGLEKSIKVQSDNFEVFSGNLTAEKLREFLINPPHIEVTKNKFKKSSLSNGNLTIKRYREVIKNWGFEESLNNETKEHIKKYFSYII